jgi:hypothetical protein
MYDSTVWYNTKTLSGSYTLSGSLTTNDGVSVQNLTASFVSASSITGSLFGTSSWAINAITASFAPNYVLTSQTSSMSVLSSSYALTSSYATNAGRAGTLDLYSITNNTSSYLLFSNTIATTGTIVGGNTDLRYNSSTKILSAVNISATSLTGSLLGTASYATNALTASYANTLDGIDSTQFARLDIANTFDGVNTTTQKTLRTDNTYTIAETLYASPTITGPDTQSIELFNIYDYITYSTDRPIANTAAIFNYTILDPNTVAIRSGQINLSWSPGGNPSEAAITETQTIVNSGESSNISFDYIIDYPTGAEYVKLRVLNGSSTDIYVRGFLRII